MTVAHTLYQYYIYITHCIIIIIIGVGLSP
jgi:hypothetical protein